MSVSRLHRRARDTHTFERAKVSGPLLFLLIAMRWYAIVAVGVAVYAFVRALP